MKALTVIFHSLLLAEPIGNGEFAIESIDVNVTASFYELSYGVIIQTN